MHWLLLSGSSNSVTVIHQVLAGKIIGSLFTLRHVGLPGLVVKKLTWGSGVSGFDSQPDK